HRCSSGSHPGRRSADHATGTPAIGHTGHWATVFWATWATSHCATLRHATPRRAVLLGDQVRHRLLLMLLTQRGLVVNEFLMLADALPLELLERLARAGPLALAPVRVHPVEG